MVNAPYTKGVFYPHEVSEMREELVRGDGPTETPAEREDRAAVIIRKRDDEKPTG